MIKKVLFRADGSSTTGLGHLYRLFSLAEIVKDTLEFVFVTQETSTDSVIPESYAKKIIPNSVKIEDEPQWLATNFSPKEYVVIADGYEFIASYQKQIKDKGYSLIYIDDLAKEHMYADVVVNHSPYLLEKHYKKEDYTLLALGTQYALIRPLFLAQAKQNRSIKAIDSAFVCFGGADPYNLTLKAVQGLLQIPDFKRIHVVLGGAYEHHEIFNLEKKHSDKIKTYKNLSEETLIKVMQLCNFAIAPASTILYELCCVKMPILSGYYVENQKNIYKGLVDKNVIVGGGEFSNYTVSDFENKIKVTLKSSKIDFYITNQYSLFDGNSKINFLGLINRLNISFRRAVENDMLIVFNWSNDELVRKSSYKSNPIELENHNKWFTKKIKDKNTLFLIALVNNIPAGIVRYEIEKKHSIVGLLVAKEFRGQSLASEFLKKSAKLYFKQFSIPVLAYIKKENKASVKAFENARYIYLKDEKIQGSISFIYKLENPNVKE